ncbi:hypothetical protein PYW08_013179 [Mythimna loreyi]|uniref:Uncharacterized protein n=1 Tax=Mythimna loreyi TaxID=667449 RepID=A0ACC2QFG2_9NEOP|nr:hypothetical protein PYW08_013179 [Mythimna loreyi]
MESVHYRLLLLAVIIITYIKTLLCVKSIPGRPVPNAEVLDELLSKFLGDSYSGSGLMDYILGTGNGTNTRTDHLDVNILDADSVKKIVKFAVQKHKKEIQQKIENETRSDTRRWNRFYYLDDYVVKTAFHLMKQTVYMTKEKVNLTRPFRKKYSDQFAYKIAILYGASATILSKMEGHLNQFDYFEYRTHFLWYLIIYEKILACNIEISDSIEKLFMIQGEFEKIRGPKPTASSKVELTQAELEAIEKNPHLRDEIIAQKNLDKKMNKG